MDKFIIIDGPAVLHRAWHALPSLTDPAGHQVSAVYGFSSLLLKLIREQQPKYLVVAFDTKEPTFRHLVYKEYKAGRVKQPQEFYDQFSMVKEVLTAFGVKFLERPGYEADDIIGGLANCPSFENLIVTGDKDTLQLVNPNTAIYFLNKGISEIKIYNQETVVQRYGLRPDQMIDYKAMRGDPSDNIAGIKGIGEKTALALLQKFGTLDQVYQSIEQDKENSGVRDSLRDLLISQKEKAMTDRKLVTIEKNVPDLGKTEDYLLKDFDEEKIKEIFNKLGFHSLARRLDNKADSMAQKKVLSQQKSLF